jgi:hypothetical protein
MVYSKTAYNEAVGKVNWHEKSSKKQVILCVFRCFLCKNWRNFCGKLLIRHPQQAVTASPPEGGSGFGRLGHGYAIPTPTLTHIAPPLG